jgi:protein phosphatase-4 regulatory subunit 3
MYAYTVNSTDDRDYPNTKGDYRNFFQSSANFKEVLYLSNFRQVVKITNLDVVSKIQRAYRAVFIKDVALARNLEDSTFSALNLDIMHRSSCPS